MSVRLSLAPQSNERLADRRRRSRRRAYIALGILFTVVLGALEYGLWQDPVRISHIVVYGADQSLAATASAAIAGSYLGIIPRNSTFFLSESSIRDPLLAAHSDIAAISMFRNGFSGLSVKIDYRVPVARWCGATPPAKRITASSTAAVLIPEESCYFFDASGFLFASTSTNAVVNPFVIYESIGEVSPVGATLPNSEKFPATFDFARQLGAQFGSPVSSIIFRDDEVEMGLRSGAYIRYVLGNEQNAFSALVSARANFNLADGSVDYVDLRFPGKVYVKPLK